MAKIHTVIGGGGLRLHVREWGSEQAPCLFFIHGWSQNHLCWAKQFNSQLADKFRIVALDLRGHGMSDSPPEVAHYNQSKLWADDVRAVIDALKLHRPILNGWSYGGLVIGDYLRIHGTNDIGGINFVGATPALNESALGSLIGPGFYENFEGATNPDLSVSIPAIIKFLRDCFEIQPAQDDFETMLSFNALVNPIIRANLAARDIDNRDVLQKIDVPALVTHGRKDKVVLPASGEFFVNHCATARASWYDGVGHAPFFEMPERFNEELAKFADAIY